MKNTKSEIAGNRMGLDELGAVDGQATTKRNNNNNNNNNNTGMG